MKVLYLIGNGFDINLSLKTKYTQFYESYIKEASKTEDIARFKQYLVNNKGKEFWSDLEILLGESTAIFDKEESFLNVYNDVNSSLRNYIERENDRLKNVPSVSSRFINYLKNPKENISNRSKLDLTNFINAVGNNWEASFISFNYTSSIETLLDGYLEKDLGKNIFEGNTSIKEIKHIHGRITDTILVGVNDVTQIANEKFRKSDKLCRRLVKPIANYDIESLEDDDCKRLINNANLIICFGLSFGKTDTIWWDGISKHLALPDKRILIFDYRNGIDITHDKFMLGDLREEIKNKIVKDKDINKTNHILYSLNSKMFSGLEACVD